jgi:hypothetical protein
MRSQEVDHLLDEDISGFDTALEQLEAVKIIRGVPAAGI